MADCPSSESRRPRWPDEAFVVQVLRYLDGQATVQDLSELKEALATRPERRTLFVRLCRLHGELSELLAPRRAALTEDGRGASPATASLPARGVRVTPRCGFAAGTGRGVLGRFGGRDHGWAGPPTNRRPPRCGPAPR